MKKPTGSMWKPVSSEKAARGRKLPLIGLSVTAFVLAFYISSVYKNITAPPRSDVPLDVSDRFQKTAQQYDKEVDSIEWWTNIHKLRRRLVREAKGHVLEASVGTGRNAPFYVLEQCKSITMVDQSSNMVDVAQEKWKKEHPKYAQAVFKVQSVVERVEPPVAGREFDTVVQTMGLCSTPEPVALLQSLGNAVQEDGRILLLEHGRSYYQWINKALDSTAPAHADKHGCWWNKDIERILEESGLEVVKLRRYHFGTTWWIELKPAKRTKDGEKSDITPNGDSTTVALAPATGNVPKAWWQVW